jgi:hypothetical protein
VAVVGRPRLGFDVSDKLTTSRKRSSGHLFSGA